MKRICFVLTCLLFFSLVLLVLYPAGQAHAQRTWSGQVLDVRTNLPVEGAVVYAGILGRADLVPPVTTGADGTFSLTYSEEQWKWFLPPSEECPSCGAFFNANHYLRVLSPATRPDWGNPYMHGYHMATFIRTSPVENLTVSLVPQFAFFRGRVVSANNTPIAGARVYLGYKTVGASAYTVGIPGSYGAWVHSDLDGYFTFSPDGPENANLFTGLHPKSWLVRPYEEYPFGFTETLFDIAPNVVPRDPNEEPGGFSDLQTRRRETGPYLAFGYRNWEWGDWFDIPQGQIITSVDDSTYAYREIVGFPIDWLGNMSSLRGYVNQPFTMVITGSASGNVWGTDIYTHDSSLAAAAVHAGAVGVGQTKTVIVRILPGQESYTGSTRNGVTSISWTSYDGSFEFLESNHPDTPPSVPTLISPANGATVAGSSITFQWNASTGALDYHFRIRAVGGSWEEDMTSSTGPNTLSFFSNDGTQYEWQVRARNSADQFSDWSTLWTFTNSNTTQQSLSGLYDSRDGVFHLQGSAPFRFGPRNSTWPPVAGDWNGYGTENVGLYDPADGVFHLHDLAPFRFGPRGSRWMSVAGDWNGNDIDSVGLYDPADGVFHLQGLAPFRFGPRGSRWLPVSGDWNGNGTDSVGLYDPADGVFHLHGLAPFRFGPRSSRWLPVAGDWNGSGIESVGLYDPTDGVFHLQGLDPFRFGPRGSSWRPLAGQW